jgi:hypothetical protein
VDSKIILEQFSKILKSYSSDASNWISFQNNYLSAWESCEYGNYLAWICINLYPEKGSELHRLTVLSACKCARLSLKYIPKEDLIPLRTIETTERWVRGETGIEEVKEAENECWEYYMGLAHNNAVNFASAAARLSTIAVIGYDHASNSPATVSHHSATAAGYSVGATTSREFNKAYSKTIKLCANIVRETIPIELIEKAAIYKDKEDTIREIIE